MSRNLIKAMLSGLSSLSGSLGLTPAIEASEKICAYLTGKGAASDFLKSGELIALRKIMPSNAIVFDVGANNGEWAAHLASLLKDPSFYLFECAPICLRELQRRLPRIPNNRVFEFAISDEIGEVSFFTPIRGSGLSSIHMRRDVGVVQEVYEEISVPRSTLDHVITANNILRVDLLKMDIEGHELSALHGARASIQNGLIRRIMFEFGSANVNSRTYFRDFWDLMSEKYEILRITPGGQLHSIKRYSEELEYFRGSTNYLAVLRN